MLTQCLCAVWDILQCIHTFSQLYPFSSLSILSFTDFRFRLFVLFSSFPSLLPPLFLLLHSSFFSFSFLQFSNLSFSPFDQLPPSPLFFPILSSILLFSLSLPKSCTLILANYLFILPFPTPFPYMLQTSPPPYSHSLHSFAFSLLQYLLSLITFPNLNSAIFCHTLSPLYF